MIKDQLQDISLYSSSEQGIIHYIEEHSEEFTHMTIEQLANASYTSNATIIRLSRKLGFSGFREMKIQWVKENESQKYIKETVDFSSPFYNLQNTQEIVQNISSLYKDSIDLCLQVLDLNKLNEIVDVMIQSKRIFIYAVGDTMITAKGFINKLSKINIFPVLVSENGEYVGISYNTTSDDCALFISYSGNAQDDSVYSLLNNNGTKIIGITSKKDSLLAKESSLLLLVADKEKKNKIATFYSQFVFEYILNCIYSLIYAKDYQINNRKKSMIDNLAGK